MSTTKRTTVYLELERRLADIEANPDASGPGPRSAPAASTASDLQVIVRRLVFLSR